MPNLIQRLTGDLTDAERFDGQRISIHSFSGAFNEWGRGKVTAGEVISAFNLDAAQQAQAAGLAALWTAAPDKVTFMRVFKDLMYLGGTNTHSRYRDISYIQARLQDEVTDQGGTVG